MPEGAVVVRVVCCRCFVAVQAVLCAIMGGAVGLYEIAL